MVSELEGGEMSENYRDNVTQVHASSLIKTKYLVKSFAWSYYVIISFFTFAHDE